MERESFVINFVPPLSSVFRHPLADPPHLPLANRKRHISRRHRQLENRPFTTNNITSSFRSRSTIWNTVSLVRARIARILISSISRRSDAKFVRKSANRSNMQVPRQFAAVRYGREAHRHDWPQRCKSGAKPNYREKFRRMFR
jgi:hypothetical protein